MPTISTPVIPVSGITKLPQSALLCASGVDATSFFQSQLTNDIKNLAASRVCLAGYCTPKGRLLATMLVWNDQDSIMLQIPGELQQALQKRLQMYVMRAKVRLDHVSDSFTVIGLLGASALQQVSRWFPDGPPAPYELVRNEFGTLMRLADSNGIARYQWIAGKAVADEAWESLEKEIPVISENIWALSEIHAGIPQILTATQEKFVPQMINYELIGGVNFKKGCYPGQEIVARTHYLGKQKRRMVLAHLDTANVQVGMEVFAAQDLTQPCGMVVNAALSPEGGTDCLIEIKTSCYHGDPVQLHSGETCHWLTMPYPLPTDLSDERPGT